MKNRISYDEKESMEKPIDARGILDQEPFACKVTKEGKALISWRGRQVTVLSGARAARFIAALERADDKEAQLLMAKATGHFKHGNEK